MEVRLSLDQTADIPFLKKLLSQIKGISEIEFLKEEEMSDEEYERKFDELLDKSMKQIENGQHVEYSKELMDSIFRKK